MLHACAQYLDSVTRSSTSPSLLSSLKVSFVIYCIPTMGPPQKPINPWIKVMTCAAAYIRAAMHRGNHEGRTYSSAERDAAHALLQECDKSEFDGTRQYRKDRWLDSSPESECPLTPEEAEEEECLYHRWCTSESFVPEESDVPDELIAVLCEITSSTKDERGRIFWRVRRLEDMAKSVIWEASSENDISSDGVCEDTLQRLGDESVGGISGPPVSYPGTSGNRLVYLPFNN